MAVGTDEREVGGHLDVALMGEGGEVDDAHAVVVALALHGLVASAIGHVNLASAHHQLVGLVAHRHLAHHLERGGVDLVDAAEHRLAADLAHIGAHISIASGKGHVAAVGYVDMAAAHGGGGMGHLHLVRHVDHHPQAAAIDLDVVAHVAQLHHLVGVARGIDVAMVGAGLEVEVVERAFVRPHVALVEHVHAHVVAADDVAGVGMGGVDHDVVVAA